MSCTKYQIGDWREYYDSYPGGCHCPVCGGFLIWKNENPICNKCKTPLMIFPDDNEYGRICPLFVDETKKRTT